jgi:hypothetical protein
MHFEVDSVDEEALVLIERLWIISPTLFKGLLYVNLSCYLRANLSLDATKSTDSRSVQPETSCFGHLFI